MTPALRRWALGWLVLGVAFGIAARLPLDSPWTLLGGAFMILGAYLATSRPNGRMFR